MGGDEGGVALERGDLTGRWEFGFDLSDGTAAVASDRAHEILAGVLDEVRDVYVPLELRLCYAVYAEDVPFDHAAEFKGPYERSETVDLHDPDGIDADQVREAAPATGDEVAFFQTASAQRGATRLRMDGDWAAVTRDRTDRYRLDYDSDAPPGSDPLALETHYLRHLGGSRLFSVELRSYADPWFRDTDDSIANRGLLRERLRAVVETLGPVDCWTDSEEFWLDNYSLGSESLMADEWWTE